MIVSHRHGFIFLKTRKTAGTSIELALRPFLGPDDIVTPVSPADELMTDVRPRNYAVREHTLSGATVLHLIAGKLGKRQIDSHATAKAVLDWIGTDTWKRYFKFAFDRNPWDRTVSDYFYYLSKKGGSMPFAEFVKRRASRLDNRSTYCLSGTVAVDKLYRYEELGEGFADACARIGIDPVPALPRAKSVQRHDRRHYSAHYDDRLAATVASKFAHEIEQLGYTFERI